MRHASLFSGIGGFDLAAEWAGWTNVFNCDIEEFPRKVLKHHFPNAIQYADIKQTDFNVHRGQIDVLTGGFPCQPFSTAGKRLGKNDERHLWPEMFRAIREIRPRWIVGENVRGLLNWSDGLVLDEVYADLESEGYEIQTFVLPAAGINAPHKRDRVWIVAHANFNRYSSCGESEETKRSRSRNNVQQEEWCEQTKRSDGLSRLQWDAPNASHIRLQETRSEQQTARTSRGSIQWDASNTNNTRAWQSMRADGEWTQDDKGWQGQPQPEHRKDGFDGNASDPDIIRLEHSQERGGMGEGKGEAWLGTSEAIEADGGNGNASNAPHNRRGGRSGIGGEERWGGLVQGELQGGQVGGQVEGCGGERSSSNAHLQRGEERYIPTKPGEQIIFGRSHNEYASNADSWGGSRSGNELGQPGSLGQGWQDSSQDGQRCDTRGETWEQFPTQSPVCGGDDGIPEELDSITISRWRKESIKAYGNAIVPQIAYRIFQTINKMENR